MAYNAGVGDPYAVDMEKVRAFLASKQEKRAREIDERFRRATEDHARIVRLLAERYRPLRIWQWGSLLDRRRFSMISDIDIALEGLSGPEEYFAILGDAMRMTDLPIDIIELEKVPRQIADHIREAGRMLYERGREG